MNGRDFCDSVNVFKTKLYDTSSLLPNPHAYLSKPLAVGEMRRKFTYFTCFNHLPHGLGFCWPKAKITQHRLEGNGKGKLASEKVRHLAKSHV